MLDALDARAAAAAAVAASPGTPPGAPRPDDCSTSFAQSAGAPRGDVSAAPLPDACRAPRDDADEPSGADRPALASSRGGGGGGALAACCVARNGEEWVRKAAALARSPARWRAASGAIVAASQTPGPPFEDARAPAEWAQFLHRAVAQHGGAPPPAG